MIEILRSIFRTLLLLLWTGFLVCAAELTKLKTPHTERAAMMQSFVRRWCKGILTLYRIRLMRIGAEHPTAALGRMVIANHRSPLDVVLLLHAFPGHFVSRADLATWPVIGFAAKKIGTIFVDRESSTSGAAIIRGMAQRLRDKETVLVFPEGTTSSGDELKPFRKGAFIAATSADCDVIPIGLAYEPGTEFVETSFFAHLLRVSKRKTTRVSMCVGSALTQERTAIAFAEKAQEAVARLVADARAALSTHAN